MTTLLEQVKALVRIGLYLLLAYLAIQMWQDPSGLAHGTIGLIKGVGHFFASLIDKIGAFVKGLTSSKK